MSEQMTASLPERQKQVELTQVLSEIQQIKSQLISLTKGIDQSLQKTWHDLLDISISEDQITEDFNKIMSLIEEAKQLHDRIFDLNQKITSANINTNLENDMGDKAKKELTSILGDLLRKIGQVRLDIATCLWELRKVACPARQIRIRIAEILNLQ